MDLTNLIKKNPIIPSISDPTDAPIPIMIVDVETSNCISYFFGFVVLGLPHPQPRFNLFDDFIIYGVNCEYFVPLQAIHSPFVLLIKVLAFKIA